MPSTVSPPTTRSVNRQPSTLEANLMFTIMENISGPLNVNWDAVASGMGYKNASVAKQRFQQVKKSLGWSGGTGGGADGGAAAGGGKMKATPTKKPMIPRVTAGKRRGRGGGTTGRGRPAQAKIVKDEILDDSEPECEEEAMVYDGSPSSERQGGDLMKSASDNEMSETELVDADEIQVTAATTPKRKLFAQSTASAKKSRTASYASSDKQAQYEQMEAEEEVVEEYNPDEQLQKEQEHFVDAREEADAKFQEAMRSVLH